MGQFNVPAASLSDVMERLSREERLACSWAADVLTCPAQYDTTIQQRLTDMNLGIPYSEPLPYCCVQLVNTDTTTQVNAASFTIVPLAGIIQQWGPTDWFTIFGAAGDPNNGGANPHSVQMNFDGTIECSFVTDFINVSGQRTAPMCQWHVNNVATGPHFNTSYARNASGAKETSNVGPVCNFDMGNGDIANLRAIQEAGAGTVTLGAAQTSLMRIKRVI